MPAKSKAQHRLMAGICKGSIKPRENLPSKKVACEFMRKTHNVKSLPQKARKRK